MKHLTLGLVAVISIVAGAPLGAAQAPAELSDVGGAVRFTVHGTATVNVVGPEGIAWQGRIDQSGLFGSQQLGQPLPDGLYRWEARSIAPAKVRGLDAEDGPSANGVIGSGIFRVADGVVNLPDSGTLEQHHLKDQVIPDDLIVQGSLCVGFDCVNNESFGFDTIRLKENNTRIKFEDTSTGTFPSTDWQLTANDSASGGQNKFSIEDITGARVPFTIEGGSTTNSIYVDSTGRIGFRTSTPVLDLHINTSNTPAIRLEQNSSGGFTAQSWDVAGNEANFFVRDVTSGSRLPLRIRPGAPTSTLDLSASGQVGVGTGSPAAKLHVTGSDGTTQLRVAETSATVALRTLLDLRNAGDLQFIMRNTDSGENWQFLAFNNGFQISQVGTTAIFSFLETGDMQIPGAYTSTSDVAAKENIVPVDPTAVLARVLDLPIATWNYRHQSADSRHIGPMAQDFFSAFQLGNDDKRIAVTDPSGVALAAIQGLHQKLVQREAEIDALSRANRELAKRLEALEQVIPTGK